MKFNQIKTGHRAIKRVLCPLVNVPSMFLPDVAELSAQRSRDAALAGAAAQSTPDHVEVGLRVLTGDEIKLISHKAKLAAEGLGAKPDESSPIYNQAVGVYTLAACCVDPDTDPSDPDPFFGYEPDWDEAQRAAYKGAWKLGDYERAHDQIMSSPHLGRDGILHLTEQHEAWQDICNPQLLKFGADKLWDMAGEVAADPTGRPFFSMRPGLRWSFTRSLAVLLVSSNAFRSTPGSDFESDTTKRSSGDAPPAPAEGS